MSRAARVTLGEAWPNTEFRYGQPENAILDTRCRGGVTVVDEVPFPVGFTIFEVSGVCHAVTKVRPFQAEQLSRLLVPRMTSRYDSEVIWP